MSDSIKISNSYPRLAASKERWKRYLFLGLVTNIAFWGSALLYLTLTPPKYTSQSAINLPGSASVTSVNLPGIGQASYENSSPYAISSAQDPRETYKFIAQSDPVLEAAATQLNMSFKEFGKPRIKIVDNSTIMKVEFKGASPDEARNKSLAFYKALEAKLSQLRTQEAIRRDASFQAALSSSQRKVEIAQKRLSDYKERSGLSANEQISELTVNIEQLRKERAEILAQQQQASTRGRQLSANLNVSAQQAADAFVLQADQIFQQSLKDYSDATAALVIAGSKFLPNHPTVTAEKAKRDAAQKALLARSQSLLGRPVSQTTLMLFNLSSTKFDASPREALFEEMVKVQADQQGLQVQAQAIHQQIAQLEGRLKKLTQDESTLDELNRDMQVAEAVFSSTLTRLDIGKSNTFGSYPFIQILTEPSLAKTPSEPKKEFVLLGTALGSLFLTSGVISLWLNNAKRENAKRE